MADASTAVPQQPLKISRSGCWGMVVSPHTVASQAGYEILSQGGNAVDAAIAVNAALSVTYPHMTGLGSDGLWLIYEAASGKVLGLNGSGRAAQSLSCGQKIPQRGAAAAVTVPGAVDAWWQAHQRFGRLPWAQLLRPAADLAKKGYPLSSSQARWSQKDSQLLGQNPAAAALFLPPGRPGQPTQNLELAQVLELLAQEGAAAFYRGEIAQLIVADLALLGCPLTLQDFANHHSDWVEPISTTYRGYRIYQLPPNTQGLTVLQILNLIEPYDIAQLSEPDYYHLMVEATKLAFRDRSRWIGDPTFSDIPVEQLISKDYADRLRGEISWQQARRQTADGGGGDTTYSAVVDRWGNGVSLLQSLYFDYGCGVAPAGLGFVLNNRGALFSQEPGHVNVTAPGKRPLHTLIPAMALHQDRLSLVFGTMGGEGQPQTQTALLTRVLDLGLDIQTAINQPRWRWGRTWGQTDVRLALEGRIDAEICQALRRRGHRLSQEPPWSEAMGHAHMIQLQPTQVLGACDPRSDGVAVGLGSTLR